MSCVPFRMTMLGFFLQIAVLLYPVLQAPLKCPVQSLGQMSDSKVVIIVVSVSSKTMAGHRSRGVTKPV